MNPGCTPQRVGGFASDMVESEPGHRAGRTVARFGSDSASSSTSEISTDSIAKRACTGKLNGQQFSFTAGTGNKRPSYVSGSSANLDPVKGLPLLLCNRQLIGDRVTLRLSTRNFFGGPSLLF